MDGFLVVMEIFESIRYDSLRPFARILRNKHDVIR
jgi:hypothetical protein